MGKLHKIHSFTTVFQLYYTHAHICLLMHINSFQAKSFLTHCIKN